MTLLESLKKMTVIVADTGDLEAIAKHKPQDATTNPSLLLKVAQQPQYRHVVDEALKYAASQPLDEAGRTNAFMEKLFVNFGHERAALVVDSLAANTTGFLSFLLDNPAGPHDPPRVSAFGVLVVLRSAERLNVHAVIIALRDSYVKRLNELFWRLHADPFDGRNKSAAPPDLPLGRRLDLFQNLALGERERCRPVRPGGC